MGLLVEAGDSAGQDGRSEGWVKACRYHPPGHVSAGVHAAACSGGFLNSQAECPFGADVELILAPTDGLATAEDRDSSVGARLLASGLAHAHDRRAAQFGIGANKRLRSGCNPSQFDALRWALLSERVPVD